MGVREVKIVLADDHNLIRSGLRSLLQKEPGFVVIGEASDGRTTLELVKQLSPDVILMDLRMPDLNGIDATRKVIALKPDIKVIGLSANTDEKSIGEMLHAGAVGYVAKDAAFEDLVTAIKTVVNGSVFFSPAVIADALRADPRDPGAKSCYSVLSVREREVLQLVAEGKSLKEVAMQMHISIKTVETHRRNLMEKLGIDNVAGLTKYAIREGLTMA